MPNQYKGGQGSTPAVCYGAPISPDLGVDPITAPLLPMVSASNPFQPCGPSVCPTTSCCGGGGDGGGGGTRAAEQPKARVPLIPDSSRAKQAAWPSSNKPDSTPASNGHAPAPALRPALSVLRPPSSALFWEISNGPVRPRHRPARPRQGQRSLTPALGPASAAPRLCHGRMHPSSRR